MRMSLLIARSFRLAMVSLVAAAPPVVSQLPQPTEPISSLKLLSMESRTESVDLHRRLTVVMFFSTRCPISNAFNYRRNQLYGDYKDRVRFLVIDPNANEPLAELRQYAHDVGFDFPVYKNENNLVADRFGVKATTDAFVVDAAGVIRYRGYIEDSPNASRAKDPALRHAIEEVLAKRPVEVAATHAVGCAIRRVKP